MIKELLEKRTYDYLDTTKQILDVYENELIRAIRFFTKTDKDIHISAVYPHPANSNFIVNVCKILVAVGDKIKTPEGEIIVVTAENMNNIPTNEMHIVLPAITLEEAHALKMYEQLAYQDKFIADHGREKFDKVIKSGVTSFNDLLEDNNEELLEELTDPTGNILESLDELQLVQYNLYLKDTKRLVH